MLEEFITDFIVYYPQAFECIRMTAFFYTVLAVGLPYETAVTTKFVFQPLIDFVYPDYPIQTSWFSHESLYDDWFYVSPYIIV